jgi:hypothetical protein
MATSAVPINKFFNPDGTLASTPDKTNKSRSYRNAARGALAAQDFTPILVNAATNAQVANAPKLAQSQLDLYKLLGPQFAQTENEINLATQQGQAANDAALLKGTGRDVTQSTLDLQQLADPEFFNLRRQIGASAGSLIEGQDPNKLTEAELANVERAQNRSNIGRGVDNSGSNTAGIKNALGFDSRMQNKRMNLLNTLTTIGNMAPNLKSGAFNYGAATGQVGAGGNAANAAIGNSFASTGANANQFASATRGDSTGLMNQMTAQHQIGGQNQAAPWEKVVGSLPDY